MASDLKRPGRFGLVRMHAFGGGKFAEIGRPGRVFESGNGYVVLTGNFDLLYWPGRAVYHGHSLRHRLSLYDARTRERIAALDSATFPINDVSFHPSEPLIAVGTGSYDGGYQFEGELLIWNHRTGEVRSLLGESREVAGCRFLHDGRLAVLLRPRHEEEFDTADAFTTFVTCVLDPREQSMRDSQGGDPRLAGLQPIDAGASGFDVTLSSSPAEHSRRLADLASSWSGTFEERHRVWDLAWLDDDSLVLALDGCLAEWWTSDGRRRTRHEGPDQGVQIFPGPPVLVHGMRRGAAHSWNGSALWTIAPDSTHELQRFAGCLAFSRVADGSLLGRGISLGGQSRAADVIVARDGTNCRSLDLGGYDCFNHYLRLDGATRHMYLAGRPPEQHLSKRLMAVSSDGERQDALWSWDRSDAHFMEGAACLAPADRLVAGYRVYDPHPGRGQAILESRSLADGRTFWSVPVDAAVSALVPVPEFSCVVFALLSGRLGALDLNSGARIWEDQASIDGLQTIVTALAARDDRVAAGTICGRTIILRINGA